ncbi:1,4-alpha-glucan branching protein GlgB [Amnibacterium endophyticum]|uniref:1,4-alpha-glucan branching enzyme GlgB n=1 Tax=Amnibacterium endophyticum TaxID=2109337 RepID=A0ABW4LGB8_9MICO
MPRKTAKTADAPAALPDGTLEGAAETAPPSPEVPEEATGGDAAGTSETAEPVETPEDDPAAPVPGEDVLGSIADGTHSGPHSVLGQHPVGDTGAVVIRALRPLARQVVAVLDSGDRVELGHVGQGVWQGVSTAGLTGYVLETTYDESTWTTDDPYRFLPSVGEVDLHLFGEGRHERLWEMLGAHHRELHGVDRGSWGTSFSVWAPHARAVRVIGDFNNWNGRLHAMRRLDGVGVWELFVPGLDPYNAYKFEILTRHGEWIEKADPMARHAEQAPATASVVTESGYVWGDSAWMSARAAQNPNDTPISVYEMHFGSWRQGLGYREAADQLIEYLHETGYTHVEFLPLAEHPYEPSWGYQVTGYYAPTSRFGHPDDLRYLIDRLHQARIGVYMDWVPGHFPKDAFALAQFDGEPLYEHSDPRLGEHMDWGTLIPNYGDSQVRNFLVANALYWLDEFHVDGLRVDAVASMLYLDYSREAGQWVPNRYGGRENLEAIAFLQETTATAYKLHPGVMMMAEESTSWGGVTHPTDHGGLGFGLKWNMGWMNDTLRYIANDPMWRSHHQNELTFSFLYSFSENFILPISHDEVVHGKGSLIGKMPGDPWQQLANVRAYLALQWAHPGKQLLFMGQEFGQRSEWAESRSLDWWILDQPAHRGLLNFVSQLNRVYRENPSFWEQDSTSAGFSWIDGSDAANSVLSFLRWDRDGNPIAALFNFSGRPVGDYRVGLPFAGTWEELLNSDAGEFGGSGVGNYGAVVAENEPSHGHPASAVLTLPPLGALYLRPKSRK